MNGKSADRPRQHFAAFVSYSHADREIARRLHRALERYVVPAKYRRLLPFGRKFSPVFRDEDEFASSPDLGLAIRKALDHSNSLLVIDTDFSRSSRWVAEEIRHFREEMAGRNIVSAQLGPATSESQFGHKDSTIVQLNSASLSRRSISAIVAGLLGVDVKTFLAHRRGEVLRRSLARAGAATLAIGFVVVFVFFLGLSGLFPGLALIASQRDPRVFTISDSVCTQATQISTQVSKIENSASISLSQDAAELSSYASEIQTQCALRESARLKKTR